MGKTKIPRVHWDTIVKAIHGRACVPFLGAGVNVEGLNNKEGLPLGGEVALRLLEAMLESKRAPTDLQHAITHKNLKDYRASTQKALTKLHQLLPASEYQTVQESIDSILREILPDDEKEEKLAHIIFDEALTEFEELMRVDLTDLARVSLRYRMNQNLEGFINKLKEIIPDADRKPSQLLRELAALHAKFRVIVTTNYDRLMERALELFSAPEIIDAGAVARKLKTDQSILSEYLRDEALSDEAAALLDNYKVEDPAFSFLPSFWAAELNQVIQENKLFELEAGDELSEKTIKQVQVIPESNGSVRRNRILLEEHFEGAIRYGKKYDSLVQPLKGFQGSAEQATRKALSETDDLILYKLHGTFCDAPPTLETRPVITEEDYIEFLTFVGADGEGIDNQIKERIKDSTLLFLGYSLEDWNFRALFKGLVEKVTKDIRPISFAIQKKPSKFWVKFWEDKSVIIFDEDLHDFAQDLAQKYLEYKNEVEAQEVARDQAWQRRREEKKRVRRGLRS
jgi:hypothetical protein